MGIAISTHLPPPVMIESTEVRRWVTHMLCWMRHVFFGGCLFREGPRQHELGLKDRLGDVHDSVEGGHHPRNCRMPDLALHVSDLPAGVALVPGAIEFLSCPPELHDEVARQVLRLGLASFFAPQANQGGLVVAHDDPRVRAANERTAVDGSSKFQFNFYHLGSPEHSSCLTAE